MRIGRWILIALATLVVLLVAAVAVLAAFVDPNSFKPQIAAEIGKATGREATLAGELDVAWFPWFAVTAEQGALANPPGFAGEPFARWRRVRIGAQLLPLLLADELRMDRIQIEGLRLQLQRRPDGRANWEGLGPLEPAADQNSADATLRDVSIAGLDLRDALISLEDSRAGSRHRLQLDALTLGALRPGARDAQPTRVELRGSLQSGAWRLQALALEGEITWGDNAFRLEDLELAFELPLAVPDAPGKSSERIAISLPRARLELDPLRAQLETLALRAGDHSTLELRNLRLQPTDVRNSDALGWSLELQARGESLRRALRLAGINAPPTRNARALGRWELASALSGAQAADASGSWRADIRRLALDDTQLSGRATKPAGEQAPIEFALTGTQIALADYLEPPEVVSEPFVFPGAALAELRARGTVELERATLDAMQMRGVTLRFVLDEQGLRTVQPPKAAR